jgi:outer membrane protein assembly factor BamB
VVKPVTIPGMQHVRGVAIAVMVAVSGAIASGEDWPQFRGPGGQGHASAGLPLTWSETSHVTWQTEIHGRAWSSPIVVGDRVWVTTAAADGKKLGVVAVDRASGKIVQDTPLFEVETPQYAHPFNTYGSPTPVADADRVYVTFGSPGTAALDAKTGKVLWTRRDFVCNHYRGAGSSPIVFRDRLIMHFDGSDHQYVVALDTKTGETIWRTERSIDFKDLGPDGLPAAEGDMRKAFATPHVTEVNGAPAVISTGSKATYAYEPMTGKEIWRVEERDAHSGSTRPVIGHGLIFVPSGFPKGRLIAIKPDGTGDITATHVAWTLDRGVPNKPSLALVGDLLFMVTDAGVASAVEAKTGKVAWTARIGGTFSASPLVSGDRIYFFDEEGKTTVIEAGPAFKVLAENQLGDGFMASPAAADGALFLRSRTRLYRVDR